MLCEFIAFEDGYCGAGGNPGSFIEFLFKEQQCSWLNWVTTEYKMKGENKEKYPGPFATTVCHSQSQPSTG